MLGIKQANDFYFVSRLGLYIHCEESKDGKMTRDRARIKGNQIPKKYQVFQSSLLW